MYLQARGSYTYVCQQTSSWFAASIVRPDMFACIVRALVRRFHSLSSSRSLREVSAHSRNENERNQYWFSDNGFPEVNIAVEISKDNARMWKVRKHSLFCFTKHAGRVIFLFLARRMKSYRSRIKTQLNVKADFRVEKRDCYTSQLKYVSWLEENVSRAIGQNSMTP